MSIFEILKMSFKSIASNKLRSFLTMLGIIIGVGAVTIIVGLGNGISTYISDSFSSLGTNTITVSINGGTFSHSVSEEEMFEIAGENSELFTGVSPKVNVSGRVKIGTESLSSSVTGVSEGYLDYAGLEIADGRNLAYMDIKDRKKVCIIGEYINSSYFSGNAVGDSIRIGGNLYSIVGVLAAQEDVPEEGGQDDCIYLPYTTAARRTGTDVNSYSFYLADEELADMASEVLDDILYEKLQNEDYYSIVSMSEMLDTLLSIVSIVILVLAIIAGISLLVGGVGIMNIMLVSVTERTREIGIRKALGAKQGSILFQFVTEAAALSCLGGCLGIALGYGLSSFGTVILYSILEEELTISPSLGSVLLSFGISAGIGILFGYLPAKKAAKLNPIDALRFE